MRFEVVDGDRRGFGISNPVVNYRLVIYTSSRCLGFLSEQKYKNINSAYKALNRLKNKLKGD